MRIFQSIGWRHASVARDVIKFSLLAMAMTGAAHAAESEKPQQSGDDTSILVTANRRAEPLHKVPVSASIVDSQALNSLFASGQDLKALAARVPSLNIESSNGRISPRFYIRGYGNTDFNTFASQPVSLVYDDVVLEAPSQKGFPIFDIENVEVLRGPQGTLFGRNAPAGVIAIHSAKPRLGETSGYVTASLGTYQSANLEGAVNVPVGDTVALRFSAQRQSREDWVNNPILDDKYDGYGDFAGRAQLLYDPGTNFSAIFDVHGRKLKGSSSLFRANIFQPGTNRLVDSLDRSEFFTDGYNISKLSSAGANARLTIGLGDLTLSSITAYESVFKFKAVGDIDGGYGAVYAPPSGPGLIPFPSTSGSDLHSLDQITQELRLASPEGSRVDWQIGLYYFHAIVTASKDAYAATGQTIANSSRSRQYNDAYAAFGSVAYEIIPDLKLRAGLRYTYDYKTFTITDAVNLVLDPTYRKADASNVSWDASAIYTVSPDLNVYAKVATGFRAPSFGAASAFNGLQVAKSETNISYEAGVKSYLFDRKATLDIGLFYYRVKDQQLSAIGGSNNATLLVNADRTKGYGLEADFSAKPTRNLTLAAGGSINVTKMKDATLVSAVCRACTVTDPRDANGFAIIDGNPLPQAARYIFNGSLTYSLPVTDSSEFYISPSIAYRGKMNFFLYSAKEFTGRSLTDVGLRGGYKWGDGRYEVAAFCRNCLDQVRAVSGVDFNNLTGLLNEPRIIGGQFRASF